MTDPTASFFDGLANRRRDPKVIEVNGTIRFDLEHDGRVSHWYLHMKQGDLTVSRVERKADCVIRAEKALFDRVVSSDTNPFAAWIRNELLVRGDLGMLRYFERLLPDPPGASDPRHWSGANRPSSDQVGESSAEQDTSNQADAVTEGLINILDGKTFVVSDRCGDIDASPASPSGLFSFDTRYLSRWRLTVDGHRLRALSVDDLQYYETRFFLVVGAPSAYVDAKVSVIRHRWIGASFDEVLTVLNHTNEPVDLRVRLEVGSDFADLFEIKEGEPKKKGRLYTGAGDGCLRLGYERENFRRETVISTTTPAEIEPHGLTFVVHIGPHGKWFTELNVKTLSGGGRDVLESLRGQAVGRPQLREELDEWLDRAPRLTCDWEPLAAVYQRSLVDLFALRVMPLGGPARQGLPAAGLPWFMAIFGRDSIFTSLQALPFLPQLAAVTLDVLGTLQGTQLDDFRDREPGKIMHEVRLGESTAFEEQPHSPYFGTADASPLFVVLLDEYERWTGDIDTIRRLEGNARAALNWIDTYGDLVGNGYISYRRRNLKNGLENQCWKDSWDSISYRDGRLPGVPRATCEMQGYAFDAKMRAARLARQFWNDPTFADQLERDAIDLKNRFNRDFWVDDGQYYALALDPEGRQVDAVSSNMGHLLWSGIAEPEQAKQIAEHLLGPKLFSGWGVRTLAEDQGRYNPVGYHVGTVWPFDNSIIAWGLRRYGFGDHAARIAESILEAAQYFQGRLPEAFAGYDRSLTMYPVQYPTACSPQAWSAGAPLMLLRTMLGLEPHDNHLIVEPVLPARIGRIDLLRIPGRWGRANAFGRGPSEMQQNLTRTRNA